MENKDIVLIMPPLWNPLQPPLGLPVLNAYLKEKNIKLSQYDLNIQFINKILTKDWMTFLIDNLKEKLSNYEKKNTLTFEEQAAYISLKTALSGLEKNIDIGEKLLPKFKEDDFFYDLESYLYLLKKIDESFLFISQFYTDVKMEIINYSSRYKNNKSQDIIKAITDKDKNNNNLFYHFFNHNFIKEIMYRDNPLVVGLSILDPQQLMAAFAIASVIKENYPEVKVAMGGPLIAKWNEILKKADKLYEVVDYFVIYEGCGTIEKIIDALKNKTAIADIPNLYYMENGKIQSPKIITKIIHHRITPDFDGLPLNEYLTPQLVIPLKASAGCFFGGCTFCEHPFLGNQKDYGYQLATPEEIVDRMVFLSGKYNTNCFNFTDSCSDARFLGELCDLLIEKKLDFKWIIFFRLDPVLDETFTRKLSKAGCIKIYTGYESANDRILQRMNKRKSSGHLPQVFKNLYEAGIALGLFVMYGFPDENEWEAENTYRTITEFLPFFNLPAFTFEFIPFIMVKQCKIFDDPEKFGIALKPQENDLSIEYQFDFIDEENQYLIEETDEIFGTMTKQYNSFLDSFPMMAFKNEVSLDVHDCMNILYVNKYGKTYDTFPVYEVKIKNKTIKKPLFGKIQHTYISLANNIVLFKSPFPVGTICENLINEATDSIVENTGEEEYYIFDPGKESYLIIEEDLYNLLKNNLSDNQISSEVLLSKMGDDQKYNTDLLNELISDKYLTSSENRLLLYDK
ncbi:MAG: radical SAM protein [Spirochaetales bacterium]|nr:radical SAM protein [Spirochaetales bacterium]